MRSSNSSVRARAAFVLGCVGSLLLIGCGSSDDHAAPDPGGAGALTASNATSSTVDLTWTAATDNVSEPADLEYRVYFSLANDIATPDAAVANGTAAGDWQAGISTLTVTSLTLGSQYYFNVLVRDEAENVTAYAPVAASTLDGTWQEVEPLEDYTTGAAYYSTLSASSRGDVMARWDQLGENATAIAVRGADAIAFADPVLFGEPSSRAIRVAYGFDDVIAGIIRTGSEDSQDLHFARYDGTSVTHDVVVTGLVPEHAQVEHVCVARNGDAMVVWEEGTASSALTVRARFHIGGAWSNAVPVSDEGVDIDLLNVVCSPDGNHLVLYSQEGTADATSLYARFATAAGELAGPATSLGEEDFSHEVAGVRADDGRFVVAWLEHTDVPDVESCRVRTYEGGAWGTRDTLRTGTSGDFQNLLLVAAGNDLHAAWRTSTTFVTRRRAGGELAWLPETPLDALSDGDGARMSGNHVGDVLFAWSENDVIRARRFTRASSTWSTAVPLKESSVLVGSGSLAAVVDARRRATVTWTEFVASEGTLSLFARTFR